MKFLTLVTVVFTRICNAKSNIPFACQDSTGACEHKNERVQFGGRYRPFISTHANSEYSVRKPTVFSCGFRDGYFKKLDLSIKKPDSVELKQYRETRIKSWIGAGVECDIASVPNPKDEKERLLCNIAKDETECRIKNERVLQFEPNSRTNCICVVLWCDQGEGLENSCMADVNIRFYDDFAIPSEKSKTLSLALIDCVTWIIFVLEIVLVLYMGYWILWRRK